jgi:hypothetical protein
MPLTQLLYTSRVGDDFEPDQIASILTQARRNNARLEITGALWFTPNYFLQVLEGRRNHINQLYSRLLQDTRHTDAELLSYGEIEKRQFSNWQMGYIPTTEKSRAIIRRYSLTGDFTPQALTGGASIRFITEMADYLTAA